ncbi:MAG: aminopeptidase, partial [Caldisericia bacterium]|nr:aminopeptidase [Caldisericia bacterium]
GEVFKNEALDVMIGSLPIEFNEKEKEAVKLNMLKILHEKYQITEEDFLSAELEIVPRGEALDVGFDRSMILGYGHDDRICAYTSLKALLDMTEPPELSSCVLLLDKEEIGSEGNTGAKTKAIEEFFEDLIALSGENIRLSKVFAKSACLSADVSAALDPHFKDAFEEKNAPYFHKGIVLSKYTGAGGKGGSSDASAEFVGKIRRLFNEYNVKFQTAELGKVDVGGGGTVAKYFGERGMEVIDAGPALLSMHAPYEICAKDDLYETYRAYSAFLAHHK